MTRKEEIKQAAKANASQMCNFCLDKYCMEMCLTCPNLHESVIAFTDGVEWADQHPKIERLWHDVSEEPTEGLQTILVNCENSELQILKYRNGTPVQWSTLVINNKITKWMYTHDILPKGGEK